MFPIHQSLNGKTAVITGGSGVLCSQMARELARQGMNVAILNRTVERGALVAGEIIEVGGKAIAIGAGIVNILSKGG